MPPAATPAPKPGIRTTEFWTTLATTMLGFLAMFGVRPQLPPQVENTITVVGGIAATVSTAAYAISRAVAKKPTANTFTVGNP